MPSLSPLLSFPLVKAFLPKFVGRLKFLHSAKVDVGKYKIEVCRTLSCAMAGAFEIIDHMEQKLGVKLGETTPDGKFTLATQECLAACGYAPMCQINGKQYHEHLTPEKVDELLASLP